ncbi:hypothetical protein CBL_21049, partial [Carabus blaptoides fortunei]
MSVNDSEENFEIFFNVCENILNESLNINNYNENENFNHFFNVCDNIISECLNGTGENLPLNQVGNGAVSRFEITSDEEKRVKKFGMIGRRVTFTMTDPPQGENP